MKVADSLLDLIGRTPLLRLRPFEAPGLSLYAKLEGFNPTGSVKDRTALALIDAAERAGALRPGMTVVEASSGNTGIGLAMVCYFVALRTIPLADAALLNFSAPVFTAILAVLLLRETLSSSALGWLGLALAGLWVGLRPSWQGAAPGYAAGLGAGIFSAAAFVTVKAMSGLESPWRIVFYFNAIASLVLLPAAVAGWRQPNPAQASWLAAISLMGTAGQVCLTLGYGRVKVSSGSTATLLAFVFSTLGGYLFWREAMPVAKVAGMAAVVVAVVGLAAAGQEAPQAAAKR